VTLNVSTPSASNTYVWRAVCIMQRNTKTAFTNLVVLAELLGLARRSQYLSETRQHDQWEMLFRGLLAPGGKSDESAIHLFEDSTTKRGLVKEQGLTSSSPLKRPKSTPEPMEMDESVDFSLHKTNPSSEEFVHEVARKFAAIGKQLEVVELTVNRHDLTAMDHHLSNVQRLIGPHPTGQAPLEILTHLESVSATIKELLAKPRSVLSETEQQQLGALLRTYGPELKLLTDNLSNSINKYLAPMEIFFQGCTSAQQPLLGDQLHSRLSLLESGLTAIQRTATNWPQPPGWAQSVRGVRDDNTNQVRALQRRVPV
jgi:hypothetical protein